VDERPPLCVIPVLLRNLAPALCSGGQRFSGRFAVQSFLHGQVESC
jgi:hypothetical protein